MNAETSGSGSAPQFRPASPEVSLSRWVNERPPAWDQILSAHDVTRLTRRSRWVLTALTLLGRFPKRKRFHGRPIGWCRTEILHWMTQDLNVDSAMRRVGQ